MTKLWPAAPGLRGRLLLSVLGGIAAVLAALTLGFNLVLADRLDTGANGLLQARASTELASLRTSHGRILLPEAPDDRSPDIQIWVFHGSRPLEQPRAARADNLIAAGLARSAPAQRDVSATDTRLTSLPVVQSGRQLGAVVAGVSLAPYDQTRHTALVASAILAVAVLIAVGLAARWMIDRALRPVALMTRQASEWSEHDIDRRFALGPPRDELTQLASTLDGLLQRLAASLRHEQRLSSEISHELRTPLASIIAEAQFALRHGPQTEDQKATLEHILHSARALQRTLDTLMAAARAQLDLQRATSDAVECAQAAVEASIPPSTHQDLEIVVHPSRDRVRVAVERDLVERILAPLLENAARHARHSVQIDIGGEAGAVQFTIQDDGPGVADEDREAIFGPGHRVGPRGPAATATTLGAGLGLALCRRLARAGGGDVHAVPSETGARFIVRLPAA